MIDMHSHCLPSLDDGAKDTDTAILMLEDALRKGVKKVFATPHCKVYSEDELKKAVEARDKAYSALMQEVSFRGALIPEVKKGFEVYLDKDITAFPSYGTLCMEDTDVMLVEMPMTYWDSFTMGRLESLKNAGITPLIAHVERYLGFKRNIEKILSADGILYQVNADAFFGMHRYGFVKKMVRMGKTVVVGSDMHDIKWRKSCIYEAYKKATCKNKNYGKLFETEFSGDIID